MAEEKKLSLREKLSEIQRKMNVPKDKHNDFGGYDYRSAESILNEFKKFSEEYKVALTLNDAIEEIAGRVYVKCTAILFDCENSGTICTDGYAREPETKPKMDESQVTGSASSYARKYAMNALFLLDDVKDPDTNEYAQQTGTDKKSGGKKEQTTADTKVNQNHINSLRKMFEKQGIDESKLLAGYKIKKIEELTVLQYKWVFDNQKTVKERFGV